MKDLSRKWIFILVVRILKTLLCLSVCVWYVSIGFSVCVCVFVFVCTHIYTHVCTHAHTHLHTHAHAHTYSAHTGFSFFPLMTLIYGFTLFMGLVSYLFTVGWWLVTSFRKFFVVILWSLGWHVFLQRALAFTSARLPSGIRPWGFNGPPMKLAQQVHPKASPCPFSTGWDPESPHSPELCSIPQRALVLQSTARGRMLISDWFFHLFIHSFMIPDLAM